MKSRKRTYLVLMCLTIQTVVMQAQSVRVAAAGNLQYIIEEIKDKYTELHPGVQVTITLGASGVLTQQIMNGAAIDFFMAADVKYPKKLKEEGCTEGSVRTYGYGRLALWSNTIDVSAGMKTLAGTGINRIAIAKPGIAPYGERAVQCMKYYNLYDALKGKLVYADNIAQAAQFAETGNAEVAFIAYALVFGAEMKGKGSCYLPDTASYKAVEQACVLIKARERNPEAVRFMNFVLGPECKPVFEKFGFIAP